MKLKTKISGMGITLVLLTAVTIVSIAFVEKNVIHEKIGSTLSESANNEAGKIVRDVYLMCRAVQESVLQSVASGLKVADRVLGDYGVVTVQDNGEPVTWKAVNQYTKQNQDINLPRMNVGSTWLGQISDPGINAPVVDEVKNLIGGTVTIFQRMNNEGDMLRVATNVIKSDGSRAIGTYIPRTNPDGSPNPVISTVLKGETFRGRAFVVDAWYVTAYQPIWNQAKNSVIGILYFGVKQENIESLRKGIMDIVVAKTGYAFVLGGKGSHKGSYIISQQGKRDGENIWEAKDADGNAFVQSLINKALSLDQNNTESEIPVAFERYPWKNPGDTEPVMKTSAITYFAPWDWVIGAGYTDTDFAATQQKLNDNLTRMINWILGVAVVIVILSLIIGWLVASGITKPILQMMRSAEKMAEGDLAQEFCLSSKDEVGQLAMTLDAMAKSLKANADVAEEIANGNLDVTVKLASEHDQFGLALQKMTSNLNDILSQIQGAGEQINSASGQVADSSQTLSQGATETAAALEEISSSMTEMASQTSQSAENASQANQLAAEARCAAENGGQQMNRMVDAMAEIKEAGQNISKIIKVIDDIAFQTNLLALNAAVEAARAGQHGKGFAVVAEEVRNLAARSAKAARETAELIEGSVEKTNNGTKIAEQTSVALQEIVGSITKVSDLVAEISAASNEQAQGITQVNQGLGQVDQTVQGNTATAEESAAAAEELSSQAEQLRHMLTRFTLAKSNSDRLQLT